MDPVAAVMVRAVLPPVVPLGGQLAVLVRGREHHLVVQHVEGALVALEVEGGLGQQRAAHEASPAAGGDLRGAVEAAAGAAEDEGVVDEAGQGLGAEGACEGGSVVTHCPFAFVRSFECLWFSLSW